MKIMKKLPAQPFFKNKRVLVRVDFNVEIKNNKVVDDFDILRSMKTIRHVAGKSKYVLLISHLGNPKEGEKLKSLAPVARYLSKLLRKKVSLVFGQPKDLKQSLSALPKGSVVMLENVRFYSGEYSRGGYVDSATFAKELASLGDCYVNEAFGESHRKVSSISAITKFLPSFAGFNFQDELKHLDKLKTKSLKPFVLILGGAKLKTKLPLIKSFIKKADYILFGGGIANTGLLSLGLGLGKSLAEPKQAKQIKKYSQLRSVFLPVDFSVATSRNSKFFKTKNSSVEKNELVLDIGPETLKQYREIVKKAGTIVWNGPMGYYENPVFARGTKVVARAILANKKAFKVIGGGDTVAFFKNARISNLKSQISNLFISTGGGAMLEYLAGSPRRSLGRSAGKKLPGIVALEKSRKR